uniref:DB domain-containing protein n=1 Tax=Strongyloides venezuelensis TaxID=75913 RepID=A0A0K0F4P0_STRVS
MTNYTIIRLIFSILLIVNVSYIKIIECQINPIVITNDFSCQRFHESFCCTDRVKKSCPEKCATVICPYNIKREDISQLTNGQLNNYNKLIGSQNINQVQKNFNKKIDNLFIVDGTAEVFNKDKNISVFEKNVNSINEKGFPTLIPITPQGKNIQKVLTTVKPPTTKIFTLFPTLPNIFTPFTLPNVLPTTTKSPLIKKNKDKPKNGNSNNKKLNKKRKNKNKVIKPPSELLHIDESDVDYEIIPETIHLPESFNISTSDSSRTTISVIHTTTTDNPTILSTPPEMIKLTRGIDCGLAPNWRPCIPMSEANLRLSTCCKNKNMPVGCQELCRYDVTEEEVKRALNTGKCSLLNVAPFLECAADRKDNINCCKSKNIAGKSGPQCEVFCSANKSGPNPYGILGIQHIVCGQTMYDLLQCHLSGLD